MSGKGKKGQPKNPIQGVNVRADKRPRRAAAGNPHADDPTVIYGFSFVDLEGPWGWGKILPTELPRVLEFLRNIERLRQHEAFGGSKNKRIELSALCADAKKRLRQIELDDLDCLWELRVGGAERIWGQRFGHVFYPVWWDPRHEVCPSRKKHT